MDDSILLGVFEKRLSLPDDPDGCWIWRGSKTNAGYGRLFHKGHSEYAHRFAFRMLVGPLAKGLQVCHRCDNPSCVNPNHLFSGTNKENSDDRDAKGRCQRGSGHYKARLSEDDVRRILRSDLPTSVLAALFGVSAPTISEIRHRKTWKHVQA